jgi:hypothetical protein
MDGWHSIVHCIDEVFVIFRSDRLVIHSIDDSDTVADTFIRLYFIYSLYLKSVWRLWHSVSVDILLILTILFSVLVMMIMSISMKAYQYRIWRPIGAKRRRHFMCLSCLAVEMAAVASYSHRKCGWRLGWKPACNKWLAGSCGGGSVWSRKWPGWPAGEEQENMA